jgi:Domain of unknown function (DUF4124)
MRPILFLALALLSLAASAQQIWKWTDEKGVIHYSENPPPNVNATKSNIKSDRPTEASVNAAQSAQRAQDDKIKAQRKAACKAGLAQVTAAQSQPRASMIDPNNGQRVYLSDAKSEARAQDARTQMRKNCD